MQNHRIHELLELLQEAWLTEPNSDLLPFLAKIAGEAGHKDSLTALTDEVLIYHLKMRGLPEDEMIPGIAKDCEDDFKAAIMSARGISEPR